MTGGRFWLGVAAGFLGGILAMYAVVAFLMSEG